ncbi:MAG TPA: hypothetical protein VFR34_08305 [Paracoccaceae bacterium]|nr:hypothetical protein [Paracoccaceae bacterium]
MAELREAADPATRLVLIDLKEGWLGGADLAALGQVCDGAILCAYDTDPGEAAQLAASGRAALGPEKILGIGFRLFYPGIVGARALRSRIQAALAAGADGIHFYNCGLVPAPRLDWVRRALGREE